MRNNNIKTSSNENGLSHFVNPIQLTKGSIDHIVKSVNALDVVSSRHEEPHSGIFIRFNSNEFSNILVKSMVNPELLHNTKEEIRYPNFRVELDAETIEMLEKTCPISPRSKCLADRFALELSDNGDLLLRYQRIRGARIIGSFSMDQVNGMIHNAANSLKNRAPLFNKIIYIDANKRTDDQVKSILDEARLNLAQDAYKHIRSQTKHLSLQLN